MPCAFGSEGVDQCCKLSAVRSGILEYLLSYVRIRDPWLQVSRITRSEGGLDVPWVNIIQVSGPLFAAGRMYLLRLELLRIIFGSFFRVLASWLGW